MAVGSGKYNGKHTWAGVGMLEAPAVATHSGRTIVLPDARVATLVDLIPRQRVGEEPVAFLEPDHLSTEHRWVIGIIDVLAVLLVVAAAAGFMLMSSGASGPSYERQVRDTVGPVVRDNSQLSTAFRHLTSSRGVNRAKTSLRITMLAVQNAQSTLATLRRGSADDGMAADVQAAMTSELTWLNGAAAILANPRSPVVLQLAALDADARTKLRAIEHAAPGASASLPNSRKLIAYAQMQDD